MRETEKNWQRKTIQKHYHFVVTTFALAEDAELRRAKFSYALLFFLSLQNASFFVYTNIDRRKKYSIEECFLKHNICHFKMRRSLRFYSVLIKNDLELYFDLQLFTLHATDLSCSSLSDCRMGRACLRRAARVHWTIHAVSDCICFNKFPLIGQHKR